MIEALPPVPVLPGETLAGKYRIERLVGQGAMGVVFVARHLRLDQQVAIKFLRPELANDEAVAERFRREAKAAAKIRGEHVARVFDVGESDDGTPFLVMEYLEGMNLAELLAAEGPLPAATAVDYVLQACEALAQAHTAGIVHRDVKPSNLFLSNRPNGSALVKVLDFGISKVSGALSTATDATVLLGSPLYMSPEQLLSSRDVDGRSDIWSLGVVLFELLTGTLPFVGDTVPQICVHIRETPAPSPRSHCPALPAGLEAVVLRCLEKDPARRLAAVPELVAALRPFAAPLSGRAAANDIGADEIGVAPRASLAARSPSRLTRLLATASVLLAVAAAVIVTATVRRRNDRGDRTSAAERAPARPPVAPAQLASHLSGQPFVGAAAPETRSSPSAAAPDSHAVPQREIASRTSPIDHSPAHRRAASPAAKGRSDLVSVRASSTPSPAPAPAEPAIPSLPSDRK